MWIACTCSCSACIHNHFSQYICSPDKIKTPQEHISFIHQRFLLKICKGSGFEGLKYRGGPEFKCGVCDKTGLMNSVLYEGSKEAEKTVRCCPGDNHDINVEMLLQVLY